MLSMEEEPIKTKVNVVWAVHFSRTFLLLPRMILFPLIFPVSVCLDIGSVLSVKGLIGAIFVIGSVSYYYPGVLLYQAKLA